jgi:hypothetical protein
MAASSAMHIDDVLAVFQGRVIARCGEEPVQADPALVAELAPLKHAQPEVFAFESLKAATLRRRSINGY